MFLSIGLFIVFVILGIGALAIAGSPDVRGGSSKPWLIAGVILLLVGYFSTSVKAVGTGEVGVVTSFGRVTGRELSEGLNVVAPWPFNGVWTADTKVQKEEANTSAASQDLQEVKAKVALNYHLNHGTASQVFQQVGSDYKQRIVDPALQETFKAVTAQYVASDLLTKRHDVKEGVKKQLVDRLSKYGVIVDDLSILNFDFSAEFNRAIEAKQVAQQQSEQAKFQVESARQQAEAQRLQKESLTPELLEKQAIERWNGVMPQYLGANSVFGIPLSK